MARWMRCAAAFASCLCPCLRGYDTAFLPWISTALAAKTPPFVVCLHCPRGQDTALCRVSPLPSRLRQCLSLRFLPQVMEMKTEAIDVGHGTTTMFETMVRPLTPLPDKSR